MRECEATAALQCSHVTVYHALCVQSVLSITFLHSDWKRQLKTMQANKTHHYSLFIRRTQLKPTENKILKQKAHKPMTADEPKCDTLSLLFLTTTIQLNLCYHKV